MSLFLKRLILIGLICALALISLFIVSKVFLYNTVTIRYEEPLKYVVVGNSHPATAFNDSLIPGFLNAARGGEWYIHSYVKLKRIIEDNPTIDTVFVELDELMMYKKTDRLNWRDNSLGVYYNYNSPFTPLADDLVILKNNALGYLLNLPVNIRVTWREAFTSDFNFSYNANILPLEKRDTISTIDAGLIRKESKKTYRPKNRSFNNVNIAYIKKIQVLCQENKKELIFVRCPVHHAFEGRVYEQQFQSFKAKTFPTIPFLDFRDFEKDAKMFHDMDHLNLNGANHFTAYFKQTILSNEF